MGEDVAVNDVILRFLYFWPRKFLGNGPFSYKSEGIQLEQIACDVISSGLHRQPGGWLKYGIQW